MNREIRNRKYSAELKPANYESCEADLFHYYPAKIDVQSLSRKSYVEDLLQPKLDIVAVHFERSGKSTAIGSFDDLAHAIWSSSEESAKGAISWKMARDSAESAGCALYCISEIGGRELHANYAFSKTKFKFSHSQSTMAREIVSSMTEGIVSSMTGEIVSKLISYATNLISSARGCEDELRGIRQSLTMIRAVLTDAERRQVRDESVKLWLQMLEDVAYEADDVLDEFAYENLRQKIEVGNQRKSKVRDICSTSNPGFFRLPMADKIKAIQESLRKGNYENDEEVLEGLEPHRCLKSLTIDGFGEKKFPSWMLTSLDAWDGILQFGNLIEIEFRNCKKCEVLPTLGLLPHLRVLTIEALRKLNLGSMPNLVEWMDVMEPATTTGLMVFTCLEELTIEGCSQLRSAPCHFSSLKKLDISDVRSTTFENIIGKLTTLTSIEVCNISELACLPEKLLQNNASLMSLMISGWADLESIVSHEDVWAFCTSLRSLKIERCWKLQIQGVPSHLQRLEICGCVILPTGLQSCTSLTLLTIQFCDKLKSIPNLGQLHSLTQLKIRYCDNLISIPDLRGLHSLIELQIWYCPKLTSLPEGLESLNRLKTLVIGEFCKELDDFPSLVSIEHLHASLQHLDLKGWPKLKSIPDNVQVLTALKSLYISDFDGMETLPEWLTKLSSLQTLRIFSCSKLKESYAIGGKERSKIAHIPNIMIWI
nr:putative disease resistance protein rga1 [Quercus suber]